MVDPVSLTVPSMQNDMQRMSLIANHAANALTPGFKRSLLSAAGVSNAKLAQAPIQATSLDFRPGVPRRSGGPLDVAIMGDGFFELTTAEGIAYTRNGSLRIDEQGRLVNAAGNAVAGLSGEIRLATSNPVIDRDGRIYEKGQQIGQLRIVHFENSQYALKAIGDGLYQLLEGMVAQEVPRPQVLQGHLEASNVDATREMVSLIETYRHFETSQRLLQIYDDMRDKTFRSLGQF